MPPPPSPIRISRDESPRQSSSSSFHNNHGHRQHHGQFPPPYRASTQQALEARLAAERIRSKKRRRVRIRRFIIAFLVAIFLLAFTIAAIIFFIMPHHDDPHLPVYKEKKLEKLEDAGSDDGEDPILIAGGGFEDGGSTSPRSRDSNPTTQRSFPAPHRLTTSYNNNSTLPLSTRSGAQGEEAEEEEAKNDQLPLPEGEEYQYHRAYIPVARRRASCEEYRTAAGYVLHGVYEVATLVSAENHWKSTGRGEEGSGKSGGGGGPFHSHRPSPWVVFKVGCLMDVDISGSSDDGGEEGDEEVRRRRSKNSWAVLQSRSGRGKPHFWNASFAEYSQGFGDPLVGDHWLGLEKLYALTRIPGEKACSFYLAIVLRGDFCLARGLRCSDPLGGYWWGEWEVRMSDATDAYRIEHLRYLRGNLSDANSPATDIFTLASVGQRFTTVDRDNDRAREWNGAIHRQRGGWWHGDFSLVALNGRYGSRTNKAEGQSWYWQERGDENAYNIKPRYSLMLFRTMTTKTS